MADRKPVRSILAATDFSAGATRAAHRAARLASQFEAELRLIHIVPREAANPFGELLQHSPREQHRIRERAKSQLASLVSELKDSAAVEANSLVRTGDLIDVAIRVADRVDLLVLGANGRRLSDVLLGSTAARVVTRCRRPTLIVRQEPEPGYRRVLVPLDFTTHSIRILEFAASFAPSAEFTLLHISERAWSAQSSDEEGAHHLRDDTRQQAIANLENLPHLAGLPAGQTGIAEERGKAGELIAERAAGSGADLIVMGKHDRSAVDEFLLGGTTRHTIMRARCDLLVVPERSGLDPTPPG